jgi:hypothetical protein
MHLMLESLRLFVRRVSTPSLLICFACLDPSFARRLVSSAVMSLGRCLLTSAVQGSRLRASEFLSLALRHSVSNISNADDVLPDLFRLVF